MGIGLVTGLGYATFYFVTGLAVTTQADNFLLVKGPDSGFLTRLQAGDVNGAFLLTRPLSERSGANPNDQTAFEDQFDMPAPGDRAPAGLLSMFARSRRAPPGGRRRRGQNCCTGCICVTSRRRFRFFKILGHRHLRQRAFEARRRQTNLRANTWVLG